MKRLGIAAIISISALCPSCATSQTAATRPPADQAATPPRLDIADSRAMYLFSLSRLHSLDGDTEGALTLLRAATETDPSGAYLYTAMAGVYLKSNQPLEALKACETAIEIDPKSFNAHQLAGNILVGLKRDREATEHFKKAIELNKNKEELYLHLAVAYVKIFEYEEAINTLKALIKVSPD
ncbi:MAG: tetratricopeptide repeat protein, partial [Geobacter sp.]|nr:tetratricopeptide repeat protein [Geobacter sp.]